MANISTNRFLSSMYGLINIDSQILDSLPKKEAQKPVNSFRSINRYEIEKQIANVRHILFEVTDKCNLRCAYCGYGDLYEDHDQRLNTDFPLESAKAFLNYMISRFMSEDNDSINYNVFISFYGGEPLLNASFIKQIIYFIETLSVSNIRFMYNITTNATLLSRHIDYLVDKKFHILVSLDGNKYNNSYRVFHSGNNSFDWVLININKVQEKYPEFFQTNIRFNAVLHNRNSVSEIYHFFKQEFDKIPKIAELNNMSIRIDKKKDFLSLYQNKQESLAQSANMDAITKDLFFDSPEIHILTFFLHQYSGNVFKTYNDLLFNNDTNNRLPTGTCFPFNKKIFITVNGKILPCERIGHQFELGQLSSDSLELDFESIASRYNEWYKKIGRQCAQCFNTQTCMQCIFNIEDLESNPICNGFMGREGFFQYVAAQMTYLEKNPGLYKKIMEEIIIE